jgi:hypothetical protein
MENRILKVGEKVTGNYNGMVLDPNGRSFKVSIGDEEIYLPKDVGTSLLERYQQGDDLFTISRTYYVYEIESQMSGRK